MKNLFKNDAKKLLNFTIIQGLEEEGPITQAIDLTRHIKHATSLIEMFEPGMKDGIIPTYQLNKNLKAVVLLNVIFPTHTEAVKNIIGLDKWTFPAPDRITMCEIDRPKILICTPSEYEKIPFEIFDGKVGYLKCG